MNNRFPAIYRRGYIWGLSRPKNLGKKRSENLLDLQSPDKMKINVRRIKLGILMGWMGMFFLISVRPVFAVANVCQNDCDGDGYKGPDDTDDCTPSESPNSCDSQGWCINRGNISAMWTRDTGCKYFLTVSISYQASNCAQPGAATAPYTRVKASLVLRDRTSPVAVDDLGDYDRDALHQGAKSA